MTVIEIAKHIKYSLPKRKLIDEKSLNYYYQAKRYDKLISLMKNHLSINCRLKIRCIDKPLPVKGHFKSANIFMPANFPLYESIEYRNLVLEISFHKELLNNFYAFVMIMSHELSHIVLYSLNHPLKFSEKATDIAAINLGFSRFFEY